MIQNETIDEIADLGYWKSFHLRTSEHSLQMTVSEDMVEIFLSFTNLSAWLAKKWNDSG